MGIVTNLFQLFCVKVSVPPSALFVVKWRKSEPTCKKEKQL